MIESFWINPRSYEGKKTNINEEEATAAPKLGQKFKSKLE
jgi:hypothetical protein